MLVLADIQFWRSRQSFEGLSVRSVLYGVFCSFIVVLYVMDNEANMLVYVSVWISLAIDLWKIKKVLDIRVRASFHRVLTTKILFLLYKHCRRVQWSKAFTSPIIE